MQVKLTFVKDTVRTSAKTNKPYTSRSIKTHEHGESYLSGFANKDNAGWKEGDTVEIEVKEVEKEGKKYLNFETPKKVDLADAKLEQILNKLTGIDMSIQVLLDYAKGNVKKSTYPPNDVPPPFPEPEEDF